MSSPSIDVENLSPTERLDLLERLWDSLSKNPAAIPVTEAQKSELARRLAAFERDGNPGSTFDEVERKILLRARKL